MYAGTDHKRSAIITSKPPLGQMRRQNILRAPFKLPRAGANFSMLFGHNTNLSVGGSAYHVQTEDRGAENALLDTTVFYSGRVLYRRTNNYFDLLPLTADTEEALKLRLDEQHRAVLEEIRSGAL